MDKRAPYPEEVPHARELLSQPYLRQYEVERICRILGYNARKAIRDLQFIQITQRHFAYETSEFEQWMKKQNNEQNYGRVRETEKHHRGC